MVDSVCPHVKGEIHFFQKLQNLPYLLIYSQRKPKKGGEVLVLSRKQDEKIVLQIDEQDDIELTVVRIDANKVRIGIKAGDEVTILREELLTKKNTS